MSKKVLIVDDEPDMINILNLRLSREGYDVLTATDGLTCIKLAEEAKPDAILLDVLLPGLGGIEVCKRLKNNARTRNIPVILLTALMGGEVSEKSAEIGAFTFISKPFDLPELMDRIREAVAQKK